MAILTITSHLTLSKLEKKEKNVHTPHLIVLIQYEFECVYVLYLAVSEQEKYAGSRLAHYVTIMKKCCLCVQSGNCRQRATSCRAD